MMLLGIEADPCDNLARAGKIAAIKPGVQRSQSMSYEWCATGPGVFNLNALAGGSPIKPPIDCNIWRSKVITNLANWTHPPKWINGTNCIQELCAFAVALHAQWPDLILELFNEPWYGTTDKLPWITSDDQLCQFMVDLATAVRTALPDATIIGPSLSNTFSPLLKIMVAKGLLNYIDAVSLHDYRLKNWAPNFSSPTQLSHVDSLTALRAYIPSGMPLVVTEFGMGDAVQGADGIVRPISDADVRGFVEPYRIYGCEILCGVCLWGMPTPGQATPTLPSQITGDNLSTWLSCWNSDGTMKPKLKSLLAAMKSVN